ncbi:MAG: molybdopterin cofactor-binding domain-containing protein, partial [Candidatus Rokuibacteriota bacterium]
MSDVELPRMLHVAFVRSVHAHARIRGVETTAAAGAPGVVAVVTGADPDFARHRVRARSALPTYVPTEQPILAWPKARYAGEAVAAVVARERYAAEDGAALVAVDYEPLPAVVDVVGPRGDRAVLHDAAPDNVLLSRRFENGDVEAALAGSAVVVERAFRANRQTAAPLEGRGGVADWNPADGKLTLWSGTQIPHLARHGLAG